MTKIPTISIGGLTLTAGRLYTLSYRCVVPTDDEGTIVAAWTGERDTWGKLTFQTPAGARHYLFLHEIADAEPAIEPPRILASMPGPIRFEPNGDPADGFNLHDVATDRYLGYVVDEPIARLTEAAPELREALHSFVVFGEFVHSDVDDHVRPVLWAMLAEARTLLARVDGTN